MVFPFAITACVSEPVKCDILVDRLQSCKETGFTCRWARACEFVEEIGEARDDSMEDVDVDWRRYMRKHWPSIVLL